MSTNHDRAITATSAANSAAGDASGNCDAATFLIESGYLERAAQNLEWAEENTRSALHRIQEARKEVAKALGGAQ